MDKFIEEETNQNTIRARIGSYEFLISLRGATGKCVIGGGIRPITITS